MEGHEWICSDCRFQAKKAIANKSVLQSATVAEKGVSEFKDLLGSHPERLKILGSLQVQLVAVVLETRRRVARKHFSSRRKSECELSGKCAVRSVKSSELR